VFLGLIQIFNDFMDSSNRANAKDNQEENEAEAN
jgi:hypothetical protein